MDRSRHPGGQAFESGDRVLRIYQNKTGTIVRVRDDEWERSNANSFHYSVQYDDGSYESYESQMFLRLVRQKIETS